MLCAERSPFREDIQGVVIATPAETHYTLAREALLADKHVYVEIWNLEYTASISFLDMVYLKL